MSSPRAQPLSFPHRRVRMQGRGRVRVITQGRPAVPRGLLMAPLLHLQKYPSLDYPLPGHSRHE